MEIYIYLTSTVLTNSLNGLILNTFYLVGYQSSQHLEYGFIFLKSVKMIYTWLNLYIFLISLSHDQN